MDKNRCNEGQNDAWPEAYGFSIYGKGPAHIVKVIAGTVADNSGLKPGDQILQINADDVSGWCAEDITKLVRKLPDMPPSLGVVSRVREISLTPTPITRQFGFSLVGTFPVKIHQIKSGSPSDDAGINKDDIVIKIDGDVITSLFQARRLADNAVRNGGIKISLIPAPSVIPSSVIKSELPKSTKVKDFVKIFEMTRPGHAKAQVFIDKIKDLYRDRPYIIEGIVRSIRQYSEDRDMEGFVYTLTAILEPPEQSIVMDELREFMPSSHKKSYDSLLVKAMKEKQSELRMRRLRNFTRDSSLPPIGFRDAVVQMDVENCFVATIRQVQIFRRYMSFGLTLRGQNPVVIQSVDPGSPAEKAGLRKGDEILSLNGLDITRIPHDRVVVLLQGSGSMPTLVIQTTSGALVTPGTTQQQMPCHASPSIDPQIYNALENMSVTTKPTTSAKTDNDQRAKDRNNNKNATEVKDNVKVTKLNSTWSHKFVSPEFKIHGENFDQHLHNLLMPSERRVIMRALENYELTKDMYDILRLINSVLDNPLKWPIWYFIVQSMKGKERILCRRMLAEMLQSQTRDQEEEDEQAAKEEASEIIAKQSEKTSTRTRRRRAIKQDVDEPEKDDTQTECDTLNRDKADEVTVTSDNNDDDGETISVRRARRRRTFAGIDLSNAYQESRHTPDISRVGNNELYTVAKPEPENSYESGARSLRRRRRETNLRRMQSAGYAESKDIDMEKDSAHIRNSLPEPVEYQPASLRERRRRQFRRSLDGTAALRKEHPTNGKLIVRRRAREAWAGGLPSQDNISGISRNLSENFNNNNNGASPRSEEDSSCEQTTEDESDMSLKSPLSMKGLRASFRISKKNRDAHDAKAAANDSTASSNDEKAKSKKGSKPGFLERMGMGKNKASHSESSGKEDGKSKKLFGKKSSSKKDADSKHKDKSASKNSANSPNPVSNKQSSAAQDQFSYPDPCEFLNDPPTPDPSFMVRNSKKRLTFSRPPKNSDTEAFLTELSAQFDDGFNIFDDLAQALQQQANNSTSQNYGVKWSYLPNGNVADPNESGSLFQSAPTNDLSELNLSDIEDKKDEIPPFPLTFDSDDETKETPAPPPPVHYEYRDRELEWERERQSRKKRRRQAFASLTQDDQSNNNTLVNDQTSPQPVEVTSHKQQEPSTQNADDDIYQVPVVRTRTRRRRQNTQTNADQAQTSFPPNTRFTRRNHPEVDPLPSSKVSENYLASLQASQNEQVKDRNSPAQEIETSSRARRRRRTSNPQQDPNTEFMDAINSLQSGEETVTNPFPVDDIPDFAGKIEDQSTPSYSRQSSDNNAPDNIVYVDDDVVYAEPRSEHSTAVRLRKKSQDYPSNGILQGDLSFTDINSLLADTDDEDDSSPPDSMHLTDGSIPMPPPPPPLAPPPPPPPPPVPGINNGPPTSPNIANVKRINWRKLELPDMNNTIWGQIGDDRDTINDVVKYLDLEQHFATKKSRELKRMSLPVRSNVVSILSHKKAYNTSILLAHLKMTVSQLRGILLSSNNQRLDSSQYKQMLLYAPDDDEATKLLVYSGDTRSLNEADQFARKMVTIPGYRLRLKSLMYKQGFSDRVEDVRKNLECLQHASLQLRKSKNLAKVLEFVLAMGNYMNRGNNRIAKATGFKIQFLADMDSTKTSDNKLTFLHILARAMYSKFPELSNFVDDLKDVRPAAKVVYPAVFQELKEMRAEWVEIRDRMPEALTKQVRGDRFKQAMESFLVESNGSLKNLELLLANTTKEFNKTAKYFGENGKGVGMQPFFTIFGEFITKFEKADREIKFIIKNKSGHAERLIS